MSMSQNNPHSPFPIPHYSRRGQALLELAIFGSLAVLLLGVLVSYGVGADVNQRAMMGSFRKALASAAVSSQDGAPSSVSHLLVQDSHVPDPSKPFAIGALSPLTMTGSVTRNYRLQDTADTEAELPRMVIHMAGGECPRESYFYARERQRSPCHFLLAGFRKETILSKSLGRYEEIYGDLNVCAKADCCNGQGCGDAGCVPGKEEERLEPNGNVVRVCPAAFQRKTVRIIDPCEGEIINYDQCLGQARAIADSDVCAQQCERNRELEGAVDCRAICQAPMNAPWYASISLEKPGSHEDGTHQWQFFNLVGAFQIQGPRGIEPIGALGLQPGSIIETTMNNVLTKHEDAAGITTTARINWRDDRTRTIIYRPYQGGAALPKSEQVTATPMDVDDDDGDSWPPVNW